MSLSAIGASSAFLNAAARDASDGDHRSVSSASNQRTGAAESTITDEKDPADTADPAARGFEEMLAAMMQTPTSTQAPLDEPTTTSLAVADSITIAGIDAAIKSPGDHSPAGSVGKAPSADMPPASALADLASTPAPPDAPAAIDPVEQPAAADQLPEMAAADQPLTESTPPLPEDSTASPATALASTATASAATASPPTAETQDGDTDAEEKSSTDARGEFQSNTSARRTEVVRPLADSHNHPPASEALNKFAASERPAHRPEEVPQTIEEPAANTNTSAPAPTAHQPIATSANPLATASPGPTPEAHVSSQVAQVLLAHEAEVPQDGERTFEIILDPPELGRLLIRMSRGTRGLEVQISAEDDRVRSILNSSASDLQQQLQLADLSLSNSGGSMPQQQSADLFREMLQFDRANSSPTTGGGRTALPVTPRATGLNVVA